MMAVRTTLDQMRAIDRAWNERRWDIYADLLGDGHIAFASGDEAAHGKPEHILKAKAFCAAFPDSHVHTDPYLDLFASYDGRRTCSVARITASATGNLQLPGGAVLRSAHKAFDVTFAAICTWRNGQIIEQRQYFDSELMLRQLGVQPDQSLSK